MDSIKIKNVDSANISDADIANMKEIDTVIFDIGNVLMSFDWIQYVTEAFGEEEMRAVSKAIFGDRRWDEFDRGIKSDEEIIQTFYDADPSRIDNINWCLDHVEGCLNKKDYAISLVQAVKASGRKALYLSNYSDFIRNAKREVLDFLPYMDGGVFSDEVNCIKPEEQIYRCIIEKYNLSPEKCVFIDDKMENLNAAQRFGFNTVWFTGYNNILLDLLTAPM